MAAFTERKRGEPDWATLLVRGENAQITHNVSFRRGKAAEAYVDLRQWCYDNGLNFSDIINSIMEPMLHFCQNFARRDKDNNVVVTLNFGDVMLEQVYVARTPERRLYTTKKNRRHQVAKRITLI